MSDNGMTKNFINREADQKARAILTKHQIAQEKAMGKAASAYIPSAWLISMGDKLSKIAGLQ